MEKLDHDYDFSVWCLLNHELTVAATSVCLRHVAQYSPIAAPNQRNAQRLCEGGRVAGGSAVTRSCSKVSTSSPQSQLR